jgi:CheY-like chemotaxis protein/anti-sigma regulatory factor (Ser/Thr protein kinase)
MNVPSHPVTTDAAPRVSPVRMTLLGHDLRAAVSDIVGGLRLIEQNGLDPETRLQLERIRSASEVMARLLEEGLAMMLGEDDPADTHPTNVQMSRFLYDVEMRWSGRAREKGLQFGVTVAEDVPQVLTLDRIALERILANILSNAIKYTDVGNVALKVELTTSDTLRFTVTDEGPGFSDAALSRLFEYEGRPEGTQKPGQGLGMHISKDMTGRLGGQISVRNLPDEGAEVTLDLPPDSWAVADADAAVELPDLSRIKVLVAEDTPTNQTLIGSMLAKMGAEYEIASDGVEALQWLERADFDLALIDIEMPRLSGIEVIRSVRARDRLHRDMPIIAVTAYVLRANRDAIYACGADAIMAKPLSGLETFGMAIGSVLERSARRDETAEQVPSQAAELNRARFDHLIEIAGPSAARELLDRLCNDLRSAERGLIGALHSNDRDGIRSETHILIALAGAVGAEVLQGLSQSLNASAHRHDAAAMGKLGQDALDHLDRLIHFVEKQRTRHGETA